MKKVYSLVTAIIIFILLILILYNPKICLNSAVYGLVLCGRVIIPSLYPFTFCILFILKSGTLNYLRFLNKLTIKTLKLSSSMFAIFILSLIGGYPLGAKMLNDSQISNKNAQVMLNYCINAGPAFVILTVGNQIFSSNKIGVLLFISHILPSFLMAFLYRNKIEIELVNNQNKTINIINNFVTSASDSASSVISICGFVILFSVICSYVNSFEFLAPLSLVLEITNAINQTRNIYIISFLLGFGGVCVWCQIFSLFKGQKINFLSFFINRVLHGGISTIIIFILIKVFKISVSTLSNGKIFTSSPFFQGQSIGISLIITGILLIISLSNKNFAGNLLKDVV